MARLTQRVHENISNENSSFTRFEILLLTFLGFSPERAALISVGQRPTLGCEQCPRGWHHAGTITLCEKLRKSDASGGFDCLNTGQKTCATFLLVLLVAEFLFFPFTVAFRVEEAGGAGFKIGIAGKTLYPVGTEFYMMGF